MLKAQQLIDDALHALDALPYNSEQLKDFSVGIKFNQRWFGETMFPSETQ